MKILAPDIRSLLAFPVTYRLFSRIVGGFARQVYVKKYIRPIHGDKILDIGCGPGDILELLPQVEYLGIDMNRRYIKSAIKRFGNRGTFICKKLSGKLSNELSSFDLILATGILHHLNDDEAIQLFELSKSKLKPGGRLITLDGCYEKKQSSIARFLLSLDRGRYVRTKNQYLALSSKIFTKIKVSIHQDLLIIPYTLMIMECTQ
jgi:SAM-dependent methyltransferase